MADDAIDYLNRINQIDPSKPFFVKYAPGATHAPHHPTKEWVEKITPCTCSTTAGTSCARRIFENQKKLGVIPGRPADALADGGPEALGRAHRPGKEAVHQAGRVFAAYAAYNDHEIGRVIQAIEDMGKLDNTLIIYINGDNGTSAEGGPLGTPNEVAFFNGVNMMPVDEQMKWYDVWGTEETYNHMSAGWSWAFDTPFDLVQAERLQAGRHQPEHGGDVAGADQGQGRAARAVHARDRRRAHHPRGHRHPGARIGGRHQAGADRGHELRLHLRQENAKAPSRHKTQYFEMMGQWALYHEGWLLSTKVNRAPGRPSAPPIPTRSTTRCSSSTT
jgi:arylsulfatase A-like enzyme